MPRRVSICLTYPLMPPCSLIWPFLYCDSGSSACIALCARTSPVLVTIVLMSCNNSSPPMPPSRLCRCFYSPRTCSARMPMARSRLPHLHAHIPSPSTIRNQHPIPVTLHPYPSCPSSLLFAADHCVYRIPSTSVPVAPSSPNVVACLELTPASLLHTPSPRIMSIPARTRSCLYVRPQGCSLLHDRGLRARVRPGSHVRILAPIIPPRMSHPDSHCGPASMIPR